MSGGLEISLPWGDGEQRFRVTIGGWRRIQAKCDAGPEEIAARLAPSVQALHSKLPFIAASLQGLVGRWRVDDVREVVYQALLGAGGDPIAIGKLMQELVDERPLRENVPLAYAIAMASIDGVPEDPPEPRVGELEGETASETPTLSPEGSFGSAASTPEEAERVSRRRKSTR